LEDRKTGRREDGKTGRQEDRKTGRQEDREDTGLRRLYDTEGVVALVRHAAIIDVRGMEGESSHSVGAQLSD
jgi:hypothetical protein